MKAKTLLNIKTFSSFLLLLNSRFQKFSKLLKFNNPNENTPLLGELAPKFRGARGGLILLLLFSTSFLSAQTLIPLTTDMVTNESGVGDATQIVDEQTEAGNPANNTGGNPFSTWYTGFNASTYPASAYIDLGEMYDLTDIYVYDMNNSGQLTVEFGSPGSWLPLTNINLNKYLKWRGKSVNAQTQYVRVTRETAGAIFAEIVLYGEVAGAPTPTPQKLALEPSMMTNEMSLGYPGMLVDEQTEAGDPANNAGGSPTSVWFTNWSPSNHPAHAYIDLGELHHIDQIYLRDRNNKGDFEVAYGSPGNWTLLLTEDLKKFNKWKEHNVDVQTQFLRFTRTTTGANCSEIVLYGYPVDNDLDAIPPAGVSDLMASATTESTINFEWTAPGDDTNTGTATSYDLRYSPTPIDNDNFDSAIPIGNMPTPSIAGTTETATLDNLPPNTTYYVALKSTDEAGNTSPLSNILTATTDENTATTPDSFKIPINPSMIVNESGLGDATDLVDEQTTAGDPINDPSGKPTTVWFTGWDAASYPVHAYLDFGKEYTLTSIFLFDTYNSGNVTISYGSPGNWIPLLTNSMPFYQKWHQHDTQITTQYLRVTRSGGGANVAEIVLYGYEDSPTANPPNTIADLSTSLPTPYSVQLSWTVPSENIGADAPVSYDLRYSTNPIDDTNFESATAATGLPTPANGGETETFTLENLQSTTLYYFAIKSTSADDLTSEISNITSETTLGILPNNQFIIPVDLNEVVNESGFGNPTLLFDEAELAGDPANNNSGGANTLWLPDFENHPASAYVDLKQTFLIDAVYLFDIIGTDEFIIEYGEPGAWQNLATVILDNLFTWTNIQTHVETRYLRFTRVTFDSNTREIVLYGSAAGLDPGPPADITDLSVTPSSTFATLEWTAPGDDENTGTATEYDIRYSTAPITSENFEDATQTEVPTPSIAGSSESVIVYNLAQNTTYYFAMKTTDEMGYTSGISNVVSTLTTTDTDTTPPAAITDLIETTVTATSVTLQWTSVGDDANIGTADVYDIRMSLQNITPATFFRAIPIEGEPLPVENGQLQSMTVNQLPSNTEICFAMKTWDEVPNISDMSNVICVTTEELEEESKIPLSPSMVTNETEHGDASNLVDEQETAGEPATSPGGSPATTWTTPFNNDVPYPIHAYIDLGEPYIVTKLFLRDVGGQAAMTVSYGYPGHWTELFTDNLSGFFSWNQHNVFVNTRYIRISKSDPSANVNELVAYGYKVDGDNIDTTPPAAITDLSATPDGSSAMDVSWTSTGDDGNTGTATVYNLRYSTKPITAENFYEAKEFEAMPAPAIAGTAQSAHIEGLWTAATYYFAIQSLDENHNISDLSNIATAKTEEVIGGDARRISLSPDMILNESALGDATLLVDEQIEAGEPIEGDESSPQLFWTAGVNPWYYPVYAYIDLGAEYDLSNIFLYDDFEESTTGPISIEVGSPFDWTPLLTDDLEGVNTWNEHDLTEEETTVTTRYVRVKLHNPQTRMSEIVLYGTATEALEEDNTEETPHAFATMDNLIGLNAFIDDPLGRMQATGAIREYHQWRWDEGNVDANSTYPGYPNNENAFNPSYVTSNWNFDRFYENIQNMGLLNTPSMTGSAHWLNPPFNEVLSRPHHVGDDSEDPFSYIEHADHLYQWVARYGNNAVGSASLKLRADQPVLSGLGTIQYFENWNEPDAFWKDENVYFTPYDYATMSSADYDGHQGAMGTTVGVKNADPTAKMAMAGITNLNLEYIRAIKLWSDEYRGGSVPFDVINLHHYSNDAGLQHAGANNGISPEEDRLKEKLEEFVTYRNKYMPGKEIWLSEFGYDTNPTSAQRALQIGSYDNEEVQGQWLVRSYLAIAAAGIDKAQMFMLRDVNASDNTIFQSSGLTESPSNDWAAKPSWYYVYTMKNRLTGMTFDSEVASGNEDVRIYKFTHPDGDAAYAVWSPTSDGTTVSGYDLSLAGGENQAVLVEMLEGDRDGVETALTINSGSVSVDVSERPVFVLVNDGVEAIPKRYTLEQQLALTTDMVTIESGVGQAERLVDEQALIGNPDLGSTTAPETIWISNGSVSSAYIDLGAEYDLTKIYLFDAVNSGDCTISIGEPGNWTPLFVDDLRYPGVWNAHVVNVTSRYVRVTMETATSFVGEVAIYAK